jgi:hypothetical protein
MEEEYLDTSSMGNSSKQVNFGMEDDSFREFITSPVSARNLSASQNSTRVERQNQKTPPLSVRRRMEVEFEVEPSYKISNEESAITDKDHYEKYGPSTSTPVPRNTRDIDFYETNGTSTPIGRSTRDMYDFERNVPAQAATNYCIRGRGRGVNIRQQNTSRAHRGFNERIDGIPRMRSISQSSQAQILESLDVQAQHLACQEQSLMILKRIDHNSQQQVRLLMSIDDSLKRLNGRNDYEQSN